MSELLTGKILLSKSVYGLFGSRDRRRLTGISLLVVLLLLTEHELIVRHRHHFGVGRIVILIVSRAQLSLVQESGCLRDWWIHVFRLLLVIRNDLGLGLDQFLHLAFCTHAISLLFEFRVAILLVFRLLCKSRRLDPFSQLL